MNTEKHLYFVFGYGNEHRPHYRGEKLATCENLPAARDILRALLYQFNGQWFGLVTSKNGLFTYEKPLRVELR